MSQTGFPDKQGLYDPRLERDACGVGFVANIKGEKSHDILQMGLTVLKNLTHRGGVGSDPLTGDGAGILFQIPDAFFRAVCPVRGIHLPPAGEYGVGMVFLPKEEQMRVSCARMVEQIIAEEGQILLGWRDVPVNPSARIGFTARAGEPVIRQVFIGARNKPEDADPDWLERKIYVIRRRIENGVMGYQSKDARQFYVASLSTRTIVYKGLFLAEQVPDFFPDLSDERMTTAMAMVHQRYSTNTFPTWELAQPFRVVCHNGEINTLRGNINWMRAREAALSSPLFGEDLKRLFPIVREGLSDSASFDRALEFLVLSGRSLPHAMMMMIPEAWENHQQMDEERKGFYEFHASLMEPWDGPAAMAFTDGRIIGATLDRNGLRPARYQVLTNDLVVMASEAGTLTFPPEQVVTNGRLRPGRMFLIDMEQGRIVEDEEIKQQIVSRQPYGQWVRDELVTLDQLPPQPPSCRSGESLLKCQQMFGYTEEDIHAVLTPMAAGGEEPVGSMGNDAPLAVLSDRPTLLFSYFKQLFAQVTNPPIDPIREELVMSLYVQLGPVGNLFQEGPEHVRRLKLTSPMLTGEELDRIRALDRHGLKARTFSCLFPADKGEEGLEESLKRLFQEVVEGLSEGVNLIILSDRGANREMVPIPSLLATSGVHHHLIRAGMRSKASLIVETGEAREVSHFALLLGFGASAVCPFLALSTLDDMVAQRLLPDFTSASVAHGKYFKALNKGLLKIFSKMGISTLQSYCGAQIFEAIGLNHALVDRFFTGAVSRIEGIGLAELAVEALRRHGNAFEGKVVFLDNLDVGGELKFRHGGERHMWNPETIAKLQAAARENDYSVFKEFAKLINEQERNLCTLRGLFRLKKARKPLSLEEVEPASEIVKRFVTGAMSFGSISKEAHETLAIAMNRMGGKSNTGEGGEDPERFKPRPNGDFANSAIKQVASARFGVNSHYLVNAKEMQIKIAQGAKPGEGGQLPGHKVNEVIAKTRNTTPGVTLISPPPHHDIYSIEDLAQLIFDLKNVNPQARVSVKLVSEIGVGVVAAGVAKGHADMILISGGDGGTGASPLSSIKHAGAPWELGLAETHQTLILNDLRGRVRLQTDGQIRTGRDVLIAALLGAEEFGFSTSALVVEGCIMMRKCHLGTCPVGVATQDPELRQKFTGKPEHVVNFFYFIANNVREELAELGFRSLDEVIGRSDLIEVHEAVNHYKAKGLDFSAILTRPDVPSRVATRCVQAQDHGLEDVLDHKLIELADVAFKTRKPIEIHLPIQNSNRTVGAMLGGRISRKFGAEGLPEDTIRCYFEGVAGQSFGAFNVPGVSLTIEGAANDYVGKGMSGGRLVVQPPRQARFAPDQNIIIGNTVLYGATGGEAFFQGMAGERFAVRNSGARTVVEGVGDHGCEYMTGGVVVVLGESGRNFAAGMSGGVAFVLDEAGRFPTLCNPAMVGLEKVEGDDVALLKEMVERHARFTGSPKAVALLTDWDNAVPRFVKVMPHEYKRVLESMKNSSQGRAANG
ncbi:MAG: glutamate synthase large subunit [Magnetococcales bacterium]|nr:glutamate synthase large subunit [Magnetococcales bacterium]